MICVLIFGLYILQVAASDYLDPSNDAANAASRQDVRDTMGSESLFNPATSTTGKNAQTATVSSGQDQPKKRLVSPMSNWHLDLQDSMDRAVELQMCQSSNVVFGKGTIVAGGLAQNVSATGTISGNKLSMDVLTDDLTLFRLALTKGGGRTFSGDFHAFSSSYVSWTGIAVVSISESLVSGISAVANSSLLPDRN